MSNLSWLLVIRNFLSNRRIFKTFLKFPSLGQFVKFSLVGILNTFLDFSIYIFLTRLIPWFGINYLFANGLSFIVAATNSFFLNKYWTFGNASKNQMFFQYAKFFLVSLFTLIIVELFLYLLVNYLGFYDLFAKILVLIISVVSNFFLNKTLVFRT